MRTASFSSDLSAVLSLLHSCFPRAKKYTAEYLKWLYLENPVGRPIGLHVLYDGEIKGQIIGIPQNIFLKGSESTALLLLDIAIHDSLRGKGLFLRGVTETEEIAKSLGFSAIIGVANASTYSGYEKLGFQNVAGLSARISAISNFRLDAGTAIRSADFFHDWRDDSLRWRMSNPLNKLLIVGGSRETFTVEGRTEYLALVARAEIPKRNLSIPQTVPAPAKPSVVISMEPKATARHGLTLQIPGFAKPSPLRLIYLNLHDRRDRINSDAVLFSFLDFDPF
jgi:predicted N-acetyltransferase YhbS